MEPAEPILLLLYGGKSDRIKKRRNAQYNQQQRFLMYRFHVKDPVYFDRSFRMVLDNPYYGLLLGKAASKTISLPWPTVLDKVLERYQHLIETNPRRG